MNKKTLTRILCGLIVITLVVFAVAYKPLKKYLTGEDLLAAK